MKIFIWKKDLEKFKKEEILESKVIKKKILWKNLLIVHIKPHIIY
jgi:hypothetical protein